jgi:hypothetical protein
MCCFAKSDAAFRREDVQTHALYNAQRLTFNAQRSTLNAQRSTLNAEQGLLNFTKLCTARYFNANTTKGLVR